MRALEQTPNVSFRLRALSENWQRQQLQEKVNFTLFCYLVAVTKSTTLLLGTALAQNNLTYRLILASTFPTLRYLILKMTESIKEICFSLMRNVKKNIKHFEILLSFA